MHLYMQVQMHFHEIILINVIAKTIGVVNKGRRVHID